VTPTAPADAVRAALAEVMDPELPVSVVDLGLIRGVEVDGETVRVALTYTSLGCPCVEMIQEDIRNRLLAMPCVRQVEIEETFEPWTLGDVSARGRLALRSVGMV